MLEHVKYLVIITFGCLAPTVCLAAPGDLDASFGSGGTVITDFGSPGFPWFDIAYALAIQSDGKIVVVGVSTVGVAGRWRVARYNGDGTLDMTLPFSFFGDSIAGATDVAIQSDGRIVVVGLGEGAEIGSGVDFGVVRYDSDGSLDDTFGTGGKVATDLGGSVDDTASAVALQADGRIVVAGTTDDDFALARYNADGTLDATFGAGGVVTTDFGSTQDVVTGLAIQADGKIVVAGNIRLSGSRDFGLARYNADGTLDATFGAGGVVTTDFGSAFDSAAGLAIQADGKIVLAGESFPDFALARYNLDGSLDTSFGAAGLVTTDFGSTGGDRARGLAIQADGKIVVAGVIYLPDGRRDFGLARYNADGTLDTAFGTAGLVTTDFGSSTGDFAADVAIQADGKIVLAGTTFDFTEPISTFEDFALARYLTDACGDGLVGATEECDDGNTADGDGCSASCTVEPGFVCPGEPSVCVPDLDGDGEPDSSDNCPPGSTPTDFNPLQGDIDGDGIGDVCDPCPGDDTNTCIEDGSAAAECSPADTEPCCISTPDGALEICIDPSSLDDPTTISITQITGPSDKAEVDVFLGSTPGIGEAVALYDFKPDSATFDPPLSITIVFNVSDLNDTQRGALTLYAEGDTGFESIDDAVCTFDTFDTSVNPEDPRPPECKPPEDEDPCIIATCTATLAHFSLFGLVAPLDSDDDGVPDDFDGVQDNCPTVPNPAQEDGNNDGLGDACDCNGNGVPDDQDIAGGSSSDGDGNGVPDECEARLDIKPGSCPNSFNRNSHGVLPVSLVGATAFDVSQVDLSTVRLWRADGAGGSVAPHEGPPGPHSVQADTATPFVGATCDCSDLQSDGITDLSMKFKTDDLVPALQLDAELPGALVELVVGGLLNDGNPFEASDCVRLVPPGTPPGLVRVTSGGNNRWIDTAPLDLVLDGGGFGTFERIYPNGSVVTLVAPATTVTGLVFDAWVVDGMRRATGVRTLQLSIVNDLHDVRSLYKRLPALGRPPRGQTTGTGVGF